MSALETAKQFLNERQPAEAVRVLRNHVLDPLAPAEAHGMLGFLLLDSREFGEAKGQFESALGKNSQDSHAAHGLGMASQGLGDGTAAQAAWEKALAINPNHAGAKKELVAHLLSTAKKAAVLFKQDDAREAFQKALALEPAQPTVAQEYLRFLVDAGDQAGARAYGQQLVQRRILNPEIESTLQAIGVGLPETAPAPVATQAPVQATAPTLDPQFQAAPAPIPKDRIQCPQCRQTLPLTAMRCQFCGANTSNVPRPVQEVKVHQRGSSSHQNMTLVWSLYYFFACLWIVDGARVMLPSLGLATKSLATGSPFASWGILGAVIGLINVLMGIGLLLKLELARKVANFLCGINLIFALFGLLGAFLMSGAMGVAGLLGVLLSIFTIALYGAQIWVIGETE